MSGLRYYLTERQDSTERTDMVRGPLTSEPLYMVGVS
jgi:hypothetical protein